MSLPCRGNDQEINGFGTNRAHTIASVKKMDFGVDKRAL
jgi:hypothetical protein